MHSDEARGAKLADASVTKLHDFDAAPEWAFDSRGVLIGEVHQRCQRTAVARQGWLRLHAVTAATRSLPDRERRRRKPSHAPAHVAAAAREAADELCPHELRDAARTSAE